MARNGRQGDLVIRSYPCDMGALRSTRLVKDVDYGFIKGIGKILHIGEGRNHFHVLDGDVEITESTAHGAFLQTAEPKGITTWILNVKSDKATMKHVDAGGVATEDHAPIELDKGTYRVTNQRQADPVTTPVRAID